jgi:hypothetical protein
VPLLDQYHIAFVSQISLAHDQAASPGPSQNGFVSQISLVHDQPTQLVPTQNGFVSQISLARDQAASPGPSQNGFVSQNSLDHYQTPAKCRLPPTVGSARRITHLNHALQKPVDGGLISDSWGLCIRWRSCGSRAERVDPRSPCALHRGHWIEWIGFGDPKSA